MRWIMAAALVCGVAGAGETKPMEAIADKTLVAWVQLSNTQQRGGSVLTLDSQRGAFDGIIFGERAPGKWMAGSDMFRRSQSPNAQAAYSIETAGPEMRVQVAIVYRGKQIALYRNGQEYARYGTAQFQTFGAGSAVVIGLRHLDAGDRACFAGAIEDARVYNVALDAAAIGALEPGKLSDPKPLAWWCFKDGPQDKMSVFPDGKLVGAARIADGKLVLDGKESYFVTPASAAPQPPPPPYDSPIHFRPARGSLADTIPFFWKGEYHMFWLHNGVGKVPWNHLVSRDLARWKELPPALVSDGAADGPDGHHMFTGSVIEHAGTFHIFYTGHNPKNPKGMEHVCHATSPDLERWTKHPEHAFGPDGAHYKAKSDFRDPFVLFNEAEKCWWMLLCTRDAKTGKPVQGVARSQDLITWEQIEPLNFDPPLAGGTPECPDLFKSGETWYLLHSPCAGTTDVRWAKDLRGPWRRPVPFAIDTSVLYAAKRLYDGKRHILTGWIRDLQGNRDGGGGMWGGTQSLPREAYEGPEGQLYFKPVGEVVAVFSKLSRETKTTVQPGIPVVVDAPDHCLLDCRVKLETPATEFTVALRQQDSGKAYRLTLRPEKKEAEIGGPGFSSKRTCFIDAAQPVKIQAFLQGTILECFINDQYAFSWRAYDLHSGKLSFAASGGKAEVEAAVKTN